MKPQFRYLLFRQNRIILYHSQICAQFPRMGGHTVVEKRGGLENNSKLLLPTNSFTEWKSLRFILKSPHEQICSCSSYDPFQLQIYKAEKYLLYFPKNVAQEYFSFYKVLFLQCSMLSFKLYQINHAIESKRSTLDIIFFVKSQHS